MQGSTTILTLAVLTSTIHAPSAAQRDSPAVGRLPDPPPPTRILQVPRRPDVVGRTYAEAESLLGRLRITVVRRDSLVLSGSEGIVLGQSPPPGTQVARGAVDTLMVSRLRAPRQVGVPNVVQAPYRVAVRRLLAARLAPVGPPLTPADSDRARVIRQEPAAPGPAPLGSPVRLTVTLDARIPVPSVIGTDTGVARTILERAGLRTAPFAVDFHDRFEAGLVFHQEPSAGDSVQHGAVVRLWMSRGPHGDTTLVPVPAVVDTALPRALEILAGAGFHHTLVDSLAPPDTGAEWVIATQAPQPGEMVLAATLVQLQARPIPLALVPNLVGLSEGDAATAATSAGFRFRVSRRVRSPRLAGTRVTTQEPAALSRIAAGSPIIATVSYPLPALATIGIGVAGLAGAAVAIRRIRPLRPRPHVSVAVRPPEVVCAEGALAKTEVGVRVDVVVRPPEVEHGSDGLILREERRHV